MVANDDGIWAEFQRLEHGHGGVHAVDARDVTGGRHDAAFAAADDDGLVADFGVVAFFDGCVKGIAVHVGDGQIEQFSVLQNARRGAVLAARFRRANS